MTWDVILFGIGLLLTGGILTFPLAYCKGRLDQQKDTNDKPIHIKVDSPIITEVVGESGKFIRRNKNRGGNYVAN